VKLRRKRRALPQCTCPWPQVVHGTESGELVCLCGGKVSREAQVAVETAKALALMDRLAYDAWAETQGIHIEVAQGGVVGHMRGGSTGPGVCSGGSGSSSGRAHGRCRRVVASPASRRRVTPQQQKAPCLRGFR
jgi:hypothetical protein